LSGGEYRWTDFLPNVDNLWKLNIVFREYLALGWYNVRGWFGETDIRDRMSGGRGAVELIS